MSEMSVCCPVFWIRVGGPESLLLLSDCEVSCQVGNLRVSIGAKIARVNFAVHCHDACARAVGPSVEVFGSNRGHEAGVA